MDLRIRNKLALVTGPAAGIGDAIARGLAESTQDTVAASGGDATACASRIAAMNLSWRLFPHPQPFSRGGRERRAPRPSGEVSWVGA
jgi:NAD(P)-dependent dehydrogenase (short-subunit alcohol dehydrogenase family)